MAEKPKPSYTKYIPKDAQVIVSIMKDMGITEYEPKVINQLLEFSYRYITSILDDSRVYANHAKKKFIDLDDVKLAVQLQLDSSFTNPPPRDVLIEIAKARNSIPLPFVKPNNGLRLPSDRYCLNNANYRLKSPVKKPGKGGYTTFGNQARFRIDTHKGYSIVKRPASFSSTSRTQTISMPKPIVKLATSSHNNTNTVKLQQSIQSHMTSLSEQNQSMIKMESDESLKRKRDEEDYDVS